MQRYVSEIVSGQIRRYNVFRGYEKNSYAGTLRIRGWLSDYQNLKKARNLRNEIVHSSNSIANNIYQNSNYQTNNYKTNRFDSQPKKSLSVFPAILAVAFILLLLFLIF